MHEPPKDLTDGHELRIIPRHTHSLIPKARGSRPELLLRGRQSSLRHNQSLVNSRWGVLHSTSAVEPD